MKEAKQNQKFPFHFLSAPPTPPAELNQKGRKIFGFVSERSEDEARIICFGNRCELGTIQTPEQNSTIFSEVFQKPKCETREARPNGFRLNPQENPPKMNPNPAHKRAEFFRRGGGAKSEAILTHSICFDTKRIFVFPYFLSGYFSTHYQLINKNI